MTQADLGFRASARTPGAGKVALAGVLTLVSIPLVGVVIFKASEVIAPPDLPEGISTVGALGLMMGMSAALAWAGILPLMLIGRWLLMRGWGGLLSFLLLGSVIGATALFWIGEAPDGQHAVGLGIAGMVYAAVFWTICRALTRDRHVVAEI